MTITLTDEQNAALKQAVAWYKDKNAPKEFYLAGYAGTGKSTLANVLIDELRESHKVKKVRTAAYTGKAALVLQKKGVPEAQTIHSLIYTHKMDKKTGEVTFTLSQESDAADADIIVLDECSMVDETLANDLRSFGKKILIMGDPGQLPPVKGAGAFTSRTPDVFLHEIHRQAQDSPIIELATMARKGEPLPLGYSKNGVRVLKLDKDTQNAIYSKETQPICGLNRVRWVYNQRIRKQLGFEGEMPVLGERVICCKNNRQQGFYNGSLGTLDKFKKLPADNSNCTPYRMDIDFDDLQGVTKKLVVDPFLFQQNFDNGRAQRAAWYKGRQRYEEFDFGYVLTCHKAQGSSWADVTVINDAHAFTGNANEWLYTAITRSEEKLTVLMR